MRRCLLALLGATLGCATVRTGPDLPPTGPASAPGPASGPASRPGSGPRAAPEGSWRDWRRPHRWLRGRDGRHVPAAEALAALAEARIVFVGERHDDPQHHAMQIELLAALYRQDPSLVIGMEMFQRLKQPALDRYLAGAIDLDGLVEEAEYERRWGWSIAFYAPILKFAKAHGIPVRALNAASELTRKVAREGLGALTPEERAGVPELDLGNAAHRARVAAAFEGHPPGAIDFERFYTAQVIWDETMAEETVRALAATGARRAVVFAGLGHVGAGQGIPRCTARRGVGPHAVVMPVRLDDVAGDALSDALDGPEADWIWLYADDEAELPGPAEAPAPEVHRPPGADT